VVDGVTGHLVDGTSAAEVATAVSRLLDDPAQARRMGAAGRDWVRAEWGWDGLGDRLRTALHDLHQAAGQPSPAVVPKAVFGAR
jgi:phosphatidylinositol alpha-1,6-mannosyltransferase